MPTAYDPQKNITYDLVNGQWVARGGGAASAPAAAAPQPVFGPPPKPEKPEKPEAPPSGYRWTNGPGSSLVAIQGGPADKNNDKTTDPKLKESENTAAFLSTNLVGNVNLLNKALKIAPDQAAPTWSQKGWGLLGQDIKNSMLPEQRQVIEDSQLAILDAALTLGTGAAYTKEQLQNYQQSFFPQIGDQPAALEAKRERLRIAMVAAKLKAGNAAPMIDQAMRQLGFDPNAAVDGSATTLPLAGGGGPNGNGGGDTPPGISEMTPEQQARDRAFLATNPTPQQYAAFMSSLLNRPIDEEAITERLNAAKKGAGYSGTVDERRSVAARIESENKRGVNESPVTTLVKQGAMLNLSDEAAGVGNALAGVLTGSDRGFGANYRLGRDTERQRIADARQQLGYAGTGLEIVGGFASANPTAALAAFSPRAALGASALGGFVSGYGSGEGTTDSLVRGAGGAAIGAAVQGGANRIASRLSGGGNMAPELAQAAEAEGVNLNRAMVDPRARGAYGAMESDPTAQPIIRSAAETTRQQMQDRTLALGGSGNALETETAGSLVQGAGRRFIQRSRGVANRLYDRARTLAGDARFEPTNALAQVDNELAQLQANPETNSAEIAFLQGLRNDLATPGGKTVEELRQLRTSLRGRVVNQNLTSTQAEARALRAMDATQQDVATAAPAAASAYRRADAFYRERQTHVDDIIQRVVGKRDSPISGEQAFARLKSMASPNGGDGRRLAALMRDLSPAERQDVAATIAHQLGRRSADEPFSADRFITMTSNLSPSARRTIFGPDGAESIQNLRTVAQAIKDSGQDINRSRTTTTANRGPWRAAAIGFLKTVTGLGSAGAGYAATGSAGGAAIGLTAAGMMVGGGMARRVLSARAMVNPRVSRWLAQAANVGTRAQAVAATRRLGTIISREPALATELRPIYDMLQGRVAQPLAAEPATDDGNNE